MATKSSNQAPEAAPSTPSTGLALSVKTAVDVVSPERLKRTHTDEMRALIMGDVQRQISPYARVTVDGAAKNQWAAKARGNKTVANFAVVTGLFLKAHDFRALWPRKKSADGKEKSEAAGVLAGGAPKCASNDGVVGVGTPGGRCAECPMSVWVEQDGKRLPPLCNNSTALLIAGIGRGHAVNGVVEGLDRIHYAPNKIIQLNLPPTMLTEFHDGIEELFAQGFEPTVQLVNISIDRPAGSLESRLTVSIAEFPSLPDANRFMELRELAGHPVDLTA